MYPSTYFRAFQYTLPGLWAKCDSRFTGKDRSSCVVTYSHINEPRASQYSILFISSTSAGVDRQSLVNRDRPHGSGVVSGDNMYMLKHLRSRSEYAFCDRVMSPHSFQSMHILRINLAFPMSLMS